MMSDVAGTGSGACLAAVLGVRCVEWGASSSELANENK